jgi:dipeptide/tripeptide permease
LFRTIFIVSIVYAIGQIILAFVSTKSSGSNLHPWIDFLGLFVIAIGTGGIKPCVSPFGGDQFDPYQTRMISIFFSVFYFSINAGSMISTFITPIFRGEFFGEYKRFDKKKRKPRVWGVFMVSNT